jgi:hypothetical protein
MVTIHTRRRSGTRPPDIKQIDERLGLAKQTGMAAGTAILSSHDTLPESVSAPPAVLSFQIGDLVRYRSNGPRAARRAMIGSVIPPTEEGSEKGWVRVTFWENFRFDRHHYDSYDSFDFAVDELELPHFWCLFRIGSGWSKCEWLGPFDSWDAAKEVLIKIIVEHAKFDKGSPLAARRDLSLENLRTATLKNGYDLTIEGCGQFNIALGGCDRPSVYVDGAGNRHA